VKGRVAKCSTLDRGEHFGDCIRVIIGIGGHVEHGLGKGFNDYARGEVHVCIRSSLLRMVHENHSVYPSRTSHRHGITRPHGRFASIWHPLSEDGLILSIWMSTCISLKYTSDRQLLVRERRLEHLTGRILIPRSHLARSKSHMASFKLFSQRRPIFPPTLSRSLLPEKICRPPPFSGNSPPLPIAHRTITPVLCSIHYCFLTILIRPLNSWFRRLSVWLLATTPTLCILRSLTLRSNCGRKTPYHRDKRHRTKKTSQPSSHSFVESNHSSEIDHPRSF
jgi:hypothetical protein